MFSRLLFRTELPFSNIFEAKVEAVEARQYTPCGRGEGQEGGLGHARCYKERDVVRPQLLDISAQLVNVEIRLASR